MSVIFQSLKKLRSNPRQRLDLDEPATGRRGLCTLPGLLLSPPVLVTALMAIGLAGYVTVFGISRLKEMSGGPQNAIPAGVQAQAAENPAAPADRSATAVPASAAVSIAAPPEVEELDGGSPERPAESLTASYLPPRAGSEIALQPADPPHQWLNRFPAPAGNGAVQQAHTRRLPQDANPADQVTQRVQAPAHSSPATLSKIQDWPEHQSPILLARQIPAQLSASAPLAKSAAELDLQTVMDRPTENIDNELSPDRIRHRAAVEKITRIADLIEAAKAAIGRMDADATKLLLAQLGQLKGPRSPYVLNLTAYWCLKREDYAAAGELLQQVLDLRQNDLEAGYNMALVEIHTQRSLDAYQRLTRLREIYPDNPAVDELMGKIK
jgi:hypothetical protein